MRMVGGRLSGRYEEREEGEWVGWLERVTWVGRVCERERVRGTSQAMRVSERREGESGASESARMGGSVRVKG